MTPAVIRGTFSDWRPVKTRGVLQLVIEVPVEQAQHVMDTLGFPMPGEEKFVAVALMNAVGGGGAPSAGTAEPVGRPGHEADSVRVHDQQATHSSGPQGRADGQGAGVAETSEPPSGQTAAPDAPKPRTPFRELKPSAQAAMKCKEPEFQRWVASAVVEGTMSPIGSARCAQETAAMVRAKCLVDSRSELDTNLEKAARWAALLTEFERDTGQIAEQRG